MKSRSRRCPCKGSARRRAQQGRSISSIGSCSSVAWCAANAQGPVDVTRERREVFESLTNLPSVAMCRSCLSQCGSATCAYIAIIGVVHVICGIAPDNRHRTAHQLETAGGAAVRQQSGNGRVIHRLRDAPRLEHGRHDDTRPWVKIG